MNRKGTRDDLFELGAALRAAGDREVGPYDDVRVRRRELERDTLHRLWGAV